MTDNNELPPGLTMQDFMEFVKYKREHQAQFEQQTDVIQGAIKQQEQARELMLRAQESQQIFDFILENTQSHQTIIYHEFPFILLSSVKSMEVRTVTNPNGMHPHEKTADKAFTMLSIISCGCHNQDQILTDVPLFSNLIQAGYEGIIDFVSINPNEILTLLGKV